MKIFNKKNNSIPTTLSSQEKCEHKFQDFPWYIEFNMTTGTYLSQNCLIYKILEPYVCIYCGERQNIVLEQREIEGCSKTDMKKILDNLQEMYSDRIKPKPIVEDMINDLKLVDVQHLRWYHYLAGTKDPSTSRTNKINNEIKLMK